jgi:serine/threonine protein kinase
MNSELNNIDNQALFSHPDMQQILSVINDKNINNIYMGSGKITGVLGKGGMAVVYEIWNKELEMKRAIKLLNKNSSSLIVNLFHNEMKITAQLDHPNIIDIFSVGRWNNIPYIEMEHVNGYSLAEILKIKKRLPECVAVSIGILVCKALEFTHNYVYTINNKRIKGVLHQDLKPSNILFSKDGILRITDFGIAAPIDENYLKKRSEFIGSLQYLAPEQIFQKDLGIPADIYSFGCSLYEMVAGQPVFQKDKIEKLFLKRKNNTFWPISSFELSIHKKLQQLITRCLEYDQSERFQNCNDLLQELCIIQNDITEYSPEKIIQMYISDFNNSNETREFKRPAKKIINIMNNKIIATTSVLTTCIIILLLSFLFRRSDSAHTNTINATNQLFNESDNGVIKSDEKDYISMLDSANDDKDTTIQTGNISPLNDDMSKKENRDTNKIIDNDILSNELSKGIIKIMESEDERGGYETVLTLYNYLTPKESEKVKPLILRHRALAKLNRLTGEYFYQTSIDDAEFLIAKIDFFYKIKNYKKVLSLLRSSKKNNTAIYLSQEEVENLFLMYKARCVSQLLYISYPRVTKKIALFYWKEVLNKYSNLPDHEFTIEARSEMQTVMNWSK